MTTLQKSIGTGEKITSMHSVSGRATRGGKSIVTLLLLASGALIAGCSTNSPRQSSIPWSQPASWEGQIPGMGQPTGR
jgi:hypothetical protein